MEFRILDSGLGVRDFEVRDGFRVKVFSVERC